VYATTVTCENLNAAAAAVTRRAGRDGRWCRAASHRSAGPTMTTTGNRDNKEILSGCGHGTAAVTVRRRVVPDSS
jgi:hypothetical protein